GAGSFVQVPLIYAAKLWGCPVIIHQQDIKPGLANLLTAPVADKITLTFAASQNGFASSFTLSGLSKGGKFAVTGNPIYINLKGYYTTEFLLKPEIAYAAASVVLSRAGLSTITELSALGKVSIIIPMPHSHQLANGELLVSTSSAIVLDQEEVTPERFIQLI